MDFTTVLGIGWDVGGWLGKKHGIAVAEWRVGTNKILWFGTTVSSISPGTIFSPQTLIGTAVKNLNLEKIKGTKLVIGIDAPLGYPSEFIKLVLGGQVLFQWPEKEIENRFAYRDTERYIYQTFSKKPLSATFDKLGNNATVAIHHIQTWCRDLGYSVHPMTEKGTDKKIIIEVYPALAKNNKGQVFEPLKDILPTDVAEGTDQYDAAICALLAVIYGANGNYPKLPKLVGPHKEWIVPSRTEGWIYHLPKQFLF